MVYCGKPSMGCRTCRARRIKCDETRPICNQCIKSRRQCSGYRSDFDILHRDETKATEARARKAAAKKAAAAKKGAKKSTEDGETLVIFDSKPIKAAPPSRAAPSSTSSSNTSPVEISFLATAPSIPVDQKASCFFASNFIMIPGQGNTRGHLDYLLPLLKADSNANSPFQLAYSACAIATMANRMKSSNLNLLELAFMQHARALSAVHKSLRDPEESKSDTTLAGVLLLGLFEKITATKELGLLAWRSHVEGAIDVVRSRGKKGLQTKNSILLFNAVRIAVIARTLSSGTAPAMGVNWWVPESLAADSVGARCQRFSLEVSDLRVEVTRMMSILARNDQGLDLMLEMLRKVQDLDHQIANYLSSLPEQYQFKTLYWERNPIPEGQIKVATVYPGRVDIYPDFVIASMWNSLRATRIILSSVLIRCAAWICSPADYRKTPEYSTAVRTCKGLIADIIASVPYFLGLRESKKELFQSTYPAGFACGFDEQSKMLGGLMVTWPLANVNTNDCTTDEQRSWVQGRLRYIADELGIGYAHSLADAKIRFPSMLMRRDGLMPTNNPLKDLQATISPKTIPVG